MMRSLASSFCVMILFAGAPAFAQVEAPVDPVDQVVEAGLMTRYPDGDFRADLVLSRAQLATILVKTFQLDQRLSGESTGQSGTAAPSITQLRDVPPSYWAYNDIQIALRSGVMRGYREGRFYPDQRVTRAEAFSIFAQAYGVFQFPEETIATVLARYPDAGEAPGWARTALATALYEGFVNTDINNQIYPARPMTRGDMAYALSRYLDRQESPADIPWSEESDSTQSNPQ